MILERNNRVFFFPLCLQIENLVKLIDVNVSHGHVLMYIQLVLMKMLRLFTRETSKTSATFPPSPLLHC